ncbi:putative inactive purple acid phosphatase 1 [Morella rubra]|uniref:Putative inactive purple acid phosphatase 1 n=1 Tax=Morella rubra TaxID=262757 RepID=A0A6A1WEJ2_9ROSI|nr:putative inactive purple acid phosphatase 1 [Morella rubra]
MDPSSSQSGILKLLLLLTTCILGLYSTTSYATSSLHPLAARSLDEHLNYTAISDFRVVNRRKLLQCPDPNPYLQITVSPNAPIADVEYLTVTVSGVLIPDSSDWVAMISPSTANVTDCPSSEAYYLQTGDTSSLSLLCQYPVKAQYVSNDPNYLSCTNTQCQVYHLFGNCIVTTCNGTITFQVVNRRTDIEFVFSAGGFDTPCILARSSPLAFANPNMPLNGHLSSIDSSGASMRLTWVSGNGAPQQVQYGNGMSQTSVVSTFTQADMCSDPALPSPAVDFGWHDPGFIHSAVMKGLQPSSTFFYRYGRYLLISDKVVQTPYMLHPQPGSISVTNAVTDQVSFLVEWDFFLSLINPVASKISYMTAIGNPERDYANSGSVYIVTADSGGECGVAYETYFQMPTPAMDKPWYSIEEASVHFTVISTEHNWSVGLANESYLLSYIVSQYNWMAANMASVDRSKTPWLVFMGHRPMYTSSNPTTSVDPLFVAAVEPLLLQYKRTCAVYQGQCLAMPTKDANGTDTYDNTNYSAPVQAIIVMAGFSLDNFTNCKEPFRAALSSKVRGIILHCLLRQSIHKMSGVKRARTTRTGTGSSSQEQEVADPMMTLERRMEYLRGRPVAKERPVTLSDFDQLLYEEHSLYQLFEYQGFLHQLSWTEGFCVDAVVQDFFCALVSVDRAPEVQLEVRGVQFLFSADVIADFLNCPRPESPCFPAVPLMMNRGHQSRICGR